MKELRCKDELPAQCTEGADSWVRVEVGLRSRFRVEDFARVPSGKKAQEQAAGLEEPHSPELEIEAVEMVVSEEEEPN